MRSRLSSSNTLHDMLRLGFVPGNLLLVFGRQGVEPVEVNFIGIVCTHWIFGFVTVPFDGQAVRHFPLFIQGIDVNSEGIFHERGGKKIGP